MDPPGSGSEIDGFRLGELLHTGTMASIDRWTGPDGPLPLSMKIPRLGPGERAVNVISFEVCRIVLGALAQSPPSATLSGEREEDTATGRHIKYLVTLRRWAKPLQLPEERVTYHVLESDKPAAALIDYARMNDVDQILIGASRSAPMRLFPGVSAQVVAEAPCSVTVVRPRSET